MDIISFNEAATANGRIEKFIENPDSNSGIVTVPKTIASGETITIPDGRVAVLPNVQVDGTLNVEGEVFIPSGSGLSTVVQKSGDTMTGNLNFASGTKITGDFSNATYSNRAVFQTSTLNTNTAIEIIPNGTSAISGVNACNSSDINNCSTLQLQTSATTNNIVSSIRGTGTYLPLVFATGGVERMRIDTSGNVGIGTTSPAGKLHVKNDTGTTMAIVGNATANTQVGVDTSGNGYLVSYKSPQMLVGNMNASGYLSIFSGSAERMRIDTAGNVGIGTSGYTGYGKLGLVGQLGVNCSSLDAITARGIQFFIDGTKYGNLSVDNYGNLLYIGNGLGYGTGSGGTVTQLTSKSTTVTLNKPSGQIQMNNATLASNTAAEFLLTNSLITANDNVYVTFSGIPSNNYSYKAKAVAGGVYIIIKNESAGSLSEAVLLNFTVIKGAVV